MTINPEAVPTTWTAADETFFRATFDAFSPAFLAGAGVLLASYDDEQIPATVPTPAATPSPANVEAIAPSAS